MAMSRLEELIAGLQILHKYAPKGDFDFQHDEGFFTGPPPDKMDPADAAKLDEWNFRWDKQYDTWAKFS